MTNIFNEILKEGCISLKKTAIEDSYKNNIPYESLFLEIDKILALLQSARKSRTIAFLSERNIEAIIWILTILKADKIIAPINPLLPINQILSIIQRLRPSHLVISKSFINLINKQNLFEIKEVGDYKTTFLLQLNYHELQEEPNLPEELAIIFFTSGTTGIPKGVMISHEGALSFIKWATKYFKVGPSEKVAHLSPYSFDLFTFEIFSTILGGGSICIVPDSLKIFPIKLSKFISEKKINIIYTVPSLYINLINRGDLFSFNFKHLRKVLFAGEVFLSPKLKQLMDAFNNAIFYNLYGPTESNVCTFYEVNKNNFNENLPVPIGKPCPYCEVKLFAQNKIAAKKGEIIVSGPNVMIGYLNMPQESKQIFIWREGKKYLKTGDYAELLSEGSLRFLGRKDRLVKISGYRIELDEIEQVISRHERVNEVSVILKEEKDKKIIMAFIIPKAKIQKEDIYKFCMKFLPHYSIPSEIYLVKKLPLTETGKINRKNLL